MTTILAGGRYECADPRRDVIDLAVRAARPLRPALHGRGSDRVATEGYRVLEVSAFGGFRGLLDGCGIDAAPLLAGGGAAAGRPGGEPARALVRRGRARPTRSGCGFAGVAARGRDQRRRRVGGAAPLLRALGRERGGAGGLGPAHPGTARRRAVDSRDLVRADGKRVKEAVQEVAGGRLILKRATGVVMGLWRRPRLRRGRSAREPQSGRQPRQRVLRQASCSAAATCCSTRPASPATAGRWSWPGRPEPASRARRCISSRRASAFSPTTVSCRAPDGGRVRGARVSQAAARQSGHAGRSSTAVGAARAARSARRSMPWIPPRCGRSSASATSISTPSTGAARSRCRRQMQALAALALAARRRTASVWIASPPDAALERLEIFRKDLGAFDLDRVPARPAERGRARRLSRARRHRARVRDRRAASTSARSSVPSPPCWPPDPRGRARGVAQHLRRRHPPVTPRTDTDRAMKTASPTRALGVSWSSKTSATSPS